MRIKYPGQLIVFLLPALISMASGAIYVENATVFNFSLNTTSMGLNSSIDSVQPRIFTEHIDSILGQSLTTPSLEFNNSLNTVRPRIFTEHIDSMLGQSLTTASLELNNSLNIVRPRIFTEHIDSMLGQSLTTPSLELNNSLNTVRPRIFTEHIDSIFGQSLTTPSLELNNSLNTVRPRIFTEHIDSILIRQLNLTSPELDNSISKVKPRIFIESADTLWLKALTNPTTDTTPPNSVTKLHETETGSTWINWTWDNPNDTDLGYVIVYINGIWKVNTSKNYFKATGLSQNTTYEIAIKTTDIWGNINETWVNDTAKTTTDLVVDGTSITLSGTYFFRNVEVINGGIIYVAPYNVSTNTGFLKIVASGSINIDSTSKIIGDQKGFRGCADTNARGEGPGGGGRGSIDGGGGAGYGGAGGPGVRDLSTTIDGVGGSTYGDNTSNSIELGSGGGRGNDAVDCAVNGGNNGGAAIWLQGQSIIVNGTVSSNGGWLTQPSINDAPGGGSGGGILFSGDNISIAGSIQAKGGYGATADDGGGGGGGGRVKIFYNVSYSRTGALNVSGGIGDGNGPNNNGSSGTVTEINTNITDNIPPASITNMHEESIGTSWINWSWTNPSDFDFNYTMLYLDGSFVDNFSGTHYNATNLLPDTVFEISTHTVDKIGNVNETWVNATVRTLAAPDNAQPIISILSPQNTSYNETNIPLEVSANEEILIWRYSLNGGENITFVQNTTISASIGANYLIIYASDIAGNWNSSGVYFFFEQADLAVNITSPIQQTFDFGTQINFSSQATGGASPYVYSWESSRDGIISNESAFNISNLSIGTQTIIITLTDANNNRSDDTKSIIINGIDLSLISSDVNFSNSWPMQNEEITISAKIINDGTENADNVHVRFFDGALLIGETTIPSISHYSSSVAQIQYAPTISGYRLIKVEVDDTNTIVEGDETNNLAIRPIAVGNGLLYGSIVLSSSIETPKYIGESTTVSGSAIYNTTFGSGENVAGALVTITINGASYKTYTTSKGTFSYNFLSPYMDGSYPVIVRIFDNTFIKEESMTLVVNDWPVTPGPGPVPEPEQIPDLVLSSTDIIFPQNAYIVGEISSINARIWNIGTADASNVPVSIYDDGALIEKKL